MNISRCNKIKRIVVTPSSKENDGPYASDNATYTGVLCQPAISASVRIPFAR
jgi:hypothetical protein